MSENGLGAIAGIITTDNQLAKEESKMLEKALVEKGYEILAEDCSNGHIIASSSKMFSRSEGVIAAIDAPVHTDIRPEEVIELYEEYGSNFMSHIKGTFRVILYDEQEEKLVVAGDKLGNRPFYYRQIEKGLIFSTHITSLTALKNFETELDQKAVYDHLNFTAVGLPYRNGKTLIKGIKKLYPSEALVKTSESTRKFIYWDPAEQDKVDITKEEALRETKKLLTERAEKVLDVLDGDSAPKILFSGGRDSTLLASLLDEVSNGDAEAVTWGVNEEYIDEAKKVAEALDISHRGIKYPETIFSEEEIWRVEEPYFLLFLKRPTLLPNHGVDYFAEGSGGELVFPEEEHRFIFREVMTDIIGKFFWKKRFENILFKLPPEGYGPYNGFDIRCVYRRIEAEESKYFSASTNLSRSITSRKLSIISNKDTEFEGFHKYVDAKWGLNKDKFENEYEKKVYLSLRDQISFSSFSSGFGGLNHLPVYLNPELIEFLFSIPWDKRPKREDMDYFLKEPITDFCDRVDDTDLYMKEFEKYFSDNKNKYTEKIDSFLARGFIEGKKAEKLLKPSNYGDIDLERMDFMVNVYMLELWIQQFVDKEEGWKSIS